MGLFDETDPFDDIVREFFGQHPKMQGYRRSPAQGVREDRAASIVEDEDSIFLIFELSGYDENDVSVEIKGRVLEIHAQKSNREGVQDYLHQKLRQGATLRKQLPASVNPKKFSHTMRNGVLEILFQKTRGGAST